MGQTEVRRAMTYIESKNGLKKLSPEYTEDSLQRRFSSMIDELSGELQDYYKQSEELDQTGQETDWNSDDKEMPILAQKIMAERAALQRRRDAAQKKYNAAVMYENWLNEYGDEFAQLYRIKDNHEQRGYSENLEIREIDITDNGDLLTNDKYNKMNAYAPEPLTELVLHVTCDDNDDGEASEDNPEPFGFNFGVMEFNQPNMPPQVKIQLSFDNETLEDLNEAKLKRVFAFCDAHGIPVSDLQIRHFDGSIAEDLIREKIEYMLEKAKAEKENKNRLEDKREKTKEETRKQELELERQKLLETNKGKEEELSWEKGEISPDVVPEHRVMKATSNQASLTREFVKQTEMPAKDMANDVLAERRILNQDDTLTTMVEMPNMPNMPVSDTNDKQPTVHTISHGVAASELVPEKGMTREIIETAKATAREAAEKSQAPQETATTTHAPQTSEGTVSQSITLPFGRRQRQQAGAPAAPLPPMPKLKMSEVEESFEKLFEKGWGKHKNLSYFKEHTGWFKSGWTEYIFYDHDDPDNRKKDGLEQKDKSVKYTYSLKLFLRMENDGLHFTYRTPNHRKIDQDTISDIVSKLKDLGYTHINFPAGLTNAEKGLWRKAMAENNIVPLNFGLNVKHARTMIDDMKKTEKYDAKTIAEYGLKLANEMKRCDAKDHKIPNQTRKIFIDGLINTHKYFAFTHAYSEILKSKVENMLRQPNPQTGSPNKFAAYLTLRRVFDVYKHALENGNSLLNVPETIKVVTDEKTGATVTITLLTPEEKRQIRDMGLGGDVQKLSSPQIEQVFDILYKRQTREEYEKFKNLLWIQAFAPDRGAKLAPNVVFSNELGFTQNEAKDIKRELESLGVEDFKPLEDTKLRMEFERFFAVEKPRLERNQNQGQPQSRQLSGSAFDERQASAETQRRPERQVEDLSPSNRPVSPEPERNITTREQASKSADEHTDSKKKKVVVRVVKVKKGKEERINRNEKPQKTRNSRETSRDENQPTTGATIAPKPQNTPSKVTVTRVVVKNQNTNSL